MIALIRLASSLRFRLEGLQVSSRCAVTPQNARQKTLGAPCEASASRRRKRAADRGWKVAQQTLASQCWRLDSAYPRSSPRDLVQLAARPGRRRALPRSFCRQRRARNRGAIARSARGHVRRKERTRRSANSIRARGIWCRRGACSSGRRARFPARRGLAIRYCLSGPAVRERSAWPCLRAARGARLAGGWRARLPGGRKPGCCAGTPCRMAASQGEAGGRGRVLSCRASSTACLTKQ